MFVLLDHIALETLLYQSHVLLECSQTLNKHQNVLHVHRGHIALVAMLWTVVHLVITALKALVTTGNLVELGHTVIQLD